MHLNTFALRSDSLLYDAQALCEKLAACVVTSHSLTDNCTAINLHPIRLPMEVSLGLVV